MLKYRTMGIRGALGRVVLCGGSIALVVACSSAGGNDAQSSNGALSQAECADAKYDDTFCQRNAADGDRIVSQCWDEANAPWKAYLDQRENARKPVEAQYAAEAAQCADDAKTKSVDVLRDECIQKHSGATAVCTGAPEALIRLWSKEQCWSDVKDEVKAALRSDPTYKALDDQYASKMSDYVRAGLGCTSTWLKNKLLDVGCYTIGNRIAKHQAVSACLLTCPEQGPGGSCVPKSFVARGELVPCGTIAVVDDVCDCHEDTSACLEYADYNDNPEPCENGGDPQCANHGCFWVPYLDDHGFVRKVCRHQDVSNP